MKKTLETVVFFGSGPVASDSLKLLAKDFVIEAVITKPAAASYEGEVPVIITSKSLGIPFYQVSSKKELSKLILDHKFSSRLAVLIDFGIIVSKDVIDYFELGIINSHFSVLPEWRGADPITFAVLSGQKKTGVSLMLLTERMDEGPLLAWQEHNIGGSITTPEITSDLIDLSHRLLVQYLPKYIQGKEKANIDQSSTGRSVSYSRKLTKQDGDIDWNKPAAALEREIRAFHGWPKSYTTFNSLRVIITKSHVIPVNGKPGSTAIIDKLPTVCAGDQALAIEEITPIGKRKMSGQAFLAGYKQTFLSKT